MAEAKAKKVGTDKKIIDVKQGGDAASGTSRQIILNNRPIMQDPMMAEVSELANAQAGAKDPDGAEAPGAPVVTRKAKVIPVTQDDTKAEPETPVPAKTVRAKKEIKPLESAPKSPAEDKPVPAEVPETKSVESTEPTSSATTAATAETAEDPKKEPEPETVKQAAEPEAKPASKDSDTSAGGLQPGRSFDESEDPAAPVDDSPADDGKQDGEVKDKKPQLQPGELTPEQQKAYDKGQYFLPIVTAETRRTRLEIILAVVFIAIVLAVWLDIMLDAGLLHVSGVQPLTHFFKS